MSFRPRERSERAEESMGPVRNRAVSSRYVSSRPRERSERAERSVGQTWVDSCRWLFHRSLDSLRSLGMTEWRSLRSLGRNDIRGGSNRLGDHIRDGIAGNSEFPPDPPRGFREHWSGRKSVIRGDRSGGDKPLPYKSSHRHDSFVGAGFIPARPTAFNEDGLTVSDAR